MKGARVYITGASGSGTSTLGRALAERLNVPHLDTDDYFWAPTDPPYTVQRPVDERVAMIAAAQPERGWVLSGAVDGWGEPVIDGVSLIVFLRTPMPIRIARLRRREFEKFGARVKIGGDMHEAHLSFLKWSSGYDDPYFRGRSLSRQTNWLSGRDEMILEMSGTDDLEQLVDRCIFGLR